MDMQNTAKRIQERSEKQLKKIRDIYAEIIRKLFVNDKPGKQRGKYTRKVEKVGNKKFRLRHENFVHAALNDFREHFKHVQLDSRGRILNPKQIGKHFSALLRIISNNVSLFVIHDEDQLRSSQLPLSHSYREEFRKIVVKGEAGAILVVKHPPEETALEIHKVINKNLHGIMSLWADKRFQQSGDIREGLKDYLQHATVKIITTGNDREIAQIVKALDEHLEQQGGFEDSHWKRVVKGVAQDEKKESLKQALGVCIPIVVIVKIIEHVIPNIMHAIGGMLDDLFGAIIPDVSQSMGDKSLPFKERSKNAWPVLKGGLITLPVAFGLGWFSAVLYGMSDSIAVHMLAGVLFALACCAGTLGTSIAAIRKSYKSIEELDKDNKNRYLVAGLSPFEKFKLAFSEAIMDVPFRVGHTMIGVPFQIALGAAAGAFGFFHSSIFIMIEGMAETLLGAITAFAYPLVARFKRNSRLRQAELDRE
jgi:hypothetical protein